MMPFLVLMIILYLVGREVLLRQSRRTRQVQNVERVLLYAYKATAA